MTLLYIDDAFDIGIHEYGEMVTAQDVVLTYECISIYLDPNVGIVTIGGDLESYQIDILDQMGQLHQYFNSMETQLSVDITSLPNGKYFLRIEHKENGKVNLQKNDKAEIVCVLYSAYKFRLFHLCDSSIHSYCAFF
ncbi:MAG: hypothetical protein ACI9FN_003237 [Saprospiraceae bacterium]|jgi:hypothetical protein